MEQSKTCTTAPRKFSDELASVYEHINAYRNKINADFDFKQADKSKPRQVALIVAVIALIVIGVISLISDTALGGSEVIRLVLQLVVLFAYLISGVALIFEYRTVKDFFKNFTGEIIGISADAAKDEAALFEDLDGRSTESIKYVANRLDQSSTQLSQIRSFLLGAIEKVGIIPGLLATVFSISKIADSTGVSWIELLSFLMLGVYMSMFPVFEASIKTKRISVLLNQYLVLFRSNEASRETTNEFENAFGGGYEHINKR
jgi:hypothetical protein